MEIYKERYLTRYTVPAGASTTRTERERPERMHYALLQLEFSISLATNCLETAKRNIICPSREQVDDCPTL